MSDTPSDRITPKILADLLIQGQFRLKRLAEAHLLAEFLSHHCPRPRLVVVGITEILVNAIEHGNLGIGYEEKTRLQLQDDWLKEIDRRLSAPENKHKYVEVDFNRTDDEIHIKVTDQGKGFDWKKYHDKDAESSAETHGRGIVLAKSLAFKSLQYSGAGNQVTCIISLKE